MPVIPSTTTRKLLVVWAVLVVAGFCAAEGASVLMERRADSLRENDFRTYLGLAAECAKRNDFAKALAQAEEAKRRAGAAAEPFVIAGDIHYQLKHWEQCIREYDHAFAHGDRGIGSRQNKLWALVELGRYDEAIAFGKEALAKGFRSAALVRCAAEAHFRAGKHVDAIPRFEEALRYYPNDLYLLEHLRQSFVKVGNDDRAKETAARIADVEASMNRFGKAGI